jgi:DNA mismatch endonuclease (patch repair protein)
MKRTYLRDGRAPIPECEAISKVMSGNKGKNTTPELLLRKALWNKGIRGYRLHWKQVPGQPDVAFVDKKVAVFVNGCYWHRCPRCHPHEPKTNSDFWKKKFEANEVRDKKKTQALQAQGWQVITIWECEIKKNIEACVEQIKQVI